MYCVGCTRHLRSRGQLCGGSGGPGLEEGLPSPFKHGCSAPPQRSFYLNFHVMAAVTLPGCVGLHDDDGLVLKVTSNGETKRVGVLGGKGTDRNFKEVKVGGLDIALKYGSKILELPFSVKLNDFIAERYPGTVGERGYKSFMSRVTINDEKPFDYDIFMNHVLDHKGYRFFQSSYNDRGEVEQTFLSVNYDQIGTWTSYVGYFFLFLGLILIVFA